MIMTCKIGIYVGSFDPFHKGHLEAVNVSLKYVDKVIIVPNNPNKTKIHRTELMHRYNMIQLSIKDDRIILTDEDVVTLNDRLYNNNYTVGIIGIDQCGKQPKLKVNEWLIVPRSGYNIINDINWSVHTRIMDVSQFRYQEGSSTDIRRQVLLGKLENIGVCNDKVLNYILNNKLYNVETVIYKLMRISDANIVKIQHNVHLVNYNNNRIIIKHYVERELFRNEKDSFIIMKEAKISVPEYIFDYDELLIGMSYTGKSLYQHVMEGYEPYKAGYLVGELLKQLHTYKTSMGTREILKNNNKLKKTNIPSLIDSYLNNPGNVGYVHGDTSVMNFTLKGDTVTMIDFGGVSKYKQWGIPAYDYYQFISSINWKFKENIIIFSLTQGFKDGYGHTEFTDEAKNLFKSYWMC